MAAKKRGLGRGLNALLGDVSDAGGAQASATLPVEFLRRGEYQPRREINPDSLQELADSISAQGIVQPVIVRATGADEYEIIAGERRWRAAQLAGLHEIPVIIRDVSDQAAMAFALIENIQREDLNPLEEAEAFQRLLREFRMTHQQVADSVGKSRASVTNLLRLIDLHPGVKELLAAGEIEMGHARALLALDRGRQLEAANRIVATAMNVRATESMVKALQAPDAPSTPKSSPADADIQRLELEIGERLGAAVRIRHRKNGHGQLVLNYSSLEELEGVLEKFQLPSA